MAMPTKTELVTSAAQFGLFPHILSDETLVELPGGRERARVWHDTGEWVCAGPGDLDPRTFHADHRAAFREARMRLRLGVL